ncbi:MAG: phosphatidate cytidylyltransferase [Proteobacteria bacterium]|nr:phosphatidate cytidylyltransferase [Pseudomonadota bacterium]
MSENKRSSLQLRVISACVLAPIAIGALILGDIYFTVFLSLAGIAMCYEWCKASVSNQTHLFIVTMSLTVVASLVFSYMGLIIQSFGVILSGAVVLTILASIIGRRSLFFWVFVGPFWVGVPLISLVALRSLPDIGFAVTIILFLAIWATDIGAYFSGKTIGGPKIAPVISPNKTWAGLVGGIISAMIVAYAASSLLIPETIAPFGIMILAGACAILAQVGDFTESAWKRRFDIKDASNLIPGHGGVLDRLDGVLFVAPVVLVLTFFYFGN